MGVELEVRSEQPSLGSLSQTLAAIKETKDPDELAILLLMVTEFYADGQCRCEEKAASYGDDSEEALACDSNVRVSRGDVLATFRSIVERLKK